MLAKAETVSDDCQGMAQTPIPVQHAGTARKLSTVTVKKSQKFLGHSMTYNT